MSGSLSFFVANGVIDFLASLAAFIAWHHFDLEAKWRMRRVRKVREQTVRLDLDWDEAFREQERFFRSWRGSAR